MLKKPKIKDHVEKTIRVSYTVLLCKMSKKVFLGQTRNTFLANVYDVYKAKIRNMVINLKYKKI